MLPVPAPYCPTSLEHPELTACHFSPRGFIDSTEFGTPSDYILDPLVKRFTVGPNPNSGNFSVQLNLLSNSKIKLRLINILTNQTVNTREETVQKDQVYTFNYNVSVPAGVYILVLETPVTTRIIKVVIN